MSNDAGVAQNGRRRTMLIAVTAIALILALAYFLYWWFDARFYVSTDDAYVAGNRVTITSEEAGVVTAIATDVTDRVTQGQDLVRLDPTDAQIALSAAEANLAQAVRETRGAYARVLAMKAELAAATAARNQAQRDMERARRLLAGHAASRAAYERALTLWQQDEARAASAQAALARQQALVRGPVIAKQPAVAAAEARVRSAAVALARCTVRAPVSGYVAQRSVELGQQISPGHPLMVIVPLNQLWVDANFKERDLRGVRIGQPVTVTTDWYGSDTVFHGRVQGISPGSGSAFSLLPPENASGNWIKVVQRVPVRIALDEPELIAHPLRIGLSSFVKIAIRNRSGPVLATAPPPEPRYRTGIYDDALAGANRLIADIINRNLRPQ